MKKGRTHSYVNVFFHQVRMIVRNKYSHDQSINSLLQFYDQRKSSPHDIDVTHSEEEEDEEEEE